MNMEYKGFKIKFNDFNQIHYIEEKGLFTYGTVETVKEDADRFLRGELLDYFNPSSQKEK